MRADREEIYFDAISIENDVAWVFAHNFNALYQVDLNRFEAFYVQSVLDEWILGRELYSTILRVNNLLVLVPLRASKIAIFNIEKERFESCPKINETDQLFGGAVFKDKVFLPLQNEPKIMVLDVVAGISYYIDFGLRYQNRKVISDLPFCRKDSTVIGENYYFTVCNDNAVAKLDMQTEKVSFFEINGCENGLRMMCEGDGDFWITEWGSPSLIKWNEEKGVIDRQRYLSNSNQVFRTGEMIYDDKIWLFPTVGDDVLTYSDKSNQWNNKTPFLPYGSESGKKKHPLQQSFPLAKRQGKDFYILSGNTMEILKYDNETESITKHKVIIEVKVAIENYYRFNGKNVIYNESREITLEDYLILI